MSDAAWRGLGALGVLFFGYLLWAFEPVLWQQALLALLGWRYIDWCLGLFGGRTGDGPWMQRMKLAEEAGIWTSKQ